MLTQFNRCLASDGQEEIEPAVRERSCNAHLTVISAAICSPCNLSPLNQSYCDFGKSRDERSEMRFTAGSLRKSALPMIVGRSAFIR
jgi:hypothetical protein